MILRMECRVNLKIIVAKPLHFSGSIANGSIVSSMDSMLMVLPSPRQMLRLGSLDLRLLRKRNRFHFTRWMENNMANADSFLKMTKKGAQDKAEKMNFLFRLIRIDG